MKYFWMMTLGLLVSSAMAERPESGILIYGCGFGQISIIDRDCETLWAMEEKREISDAWLMDDGDIVYSFKDGIRMVRPDYKSGSGAKKVWQWDTPKIKTTVINKIMLNGEEQLWEKQTQAKGETHSCQPLGDGKFLVGISYDGVSFIIEIDKNGKVYKKVMLDGYGTAHNSFRVIRKTKKGTYLTTQQHGNGVAFEYNSNGKMIRKFVDGKYVAVRLKNGNTLIACGGAHRIIEVDAKDKIVWKLEQKDMPDEQLGFIAGIEELDNGNILIANWGGHGGGNCAAMLEVSKDKKVVWKSTKAIKNRVSGVCVIRNKANDELVR